MSSRSFTRAFDVLLFLPALACGSGHAGSGDVANALEATIQAETTFAGMRGRYAAYRVRLSGVGGVAVTGRLLRPLPTGAAAGARHPAVVLQDGRELNSAAVDFLPAEFGDIVVISLDYPEELPYEVSLGALLTGADRLQRAARRIAPSFSRAADYLASRGDVDTTRMVLVATSFAVPFAVKAAATDARFVNVGLVYGAGKMDDVLAANLTLRPRFLRPMAAWLAMRPFAEFAPERFVARIAPRPLVMVNGLDDPQMPQGAVRSLFDAAREPKTLIWLRTGHLMPTDSALIRVLVDTTLARLPALAMSRRGSTR
jgi:hypothetical protein